MNSEVKNKLAAVGKAKRAAKRLLKDVTPDELRIASDYIKESSPELFPIGTHVEALTGEVIAYLSRATPEQIAALKECIPWVEYNLFGYLRVRTLFHCEVLDHLLSALRVTDHPKYIKTLRYAYNPELRWYRVRRCPSSPKAK
jgi:hypothetical protein